MVRSQMFSAVLQAVALWALTSIVSHHLLTNTVENAMKSELVSNFTTAVELSEKQWTNNNTAFGKSSLALNGTLYALNATHNATITKSEGVANITSQTSSKPSDPPKSFYWHTFPRSILVTSIVAVLQYYWFIWLERTFPGRSRPSDYHGVSSTTTGDKYDDEGEADETHEEAVVRKWIARGKVRRASLNWWNTFVKWALDMSVGSICIQIVKYVMHDVVLAWSVKNFSADERWWVKWEILLRWSFSFADIRPLTSLIALVVVPAHKRIVFLAAADLVWMACFGLLLRQVLLMLERSEYVQGFVANFTEEMKRQNEWPNSQKSMFNVTRQSDEL